MWWMFVWGLEGGGRREISIILENDGSGESWMKKLQRKRREAGELEGGKRLVGRTDAERV